MCDLDAVGCPCGFVFAVTAGPTPVMAAYPRASYEPGFGQASGPSVAERIIPTKNPKALISYYCGVFSLVPCFTSPILGIVAIVLGMLGLKECKRDPNLPGKGHAITGIVLGGIMTLLSLVGICFFVFALLNQPKT